MKKKENLLIDCSYIEKSWVSTGSLVVYAGRIIQGFLRYGHCHAYVLLWREMEDYIDGLVGQEYDKIVLDREDVFITWRLYYRLFVFFTTSIENRTEKKGYLCDSYAQYYVWIFLLSKALSPLCHCT